MPGTGTTQPNQAANGCELKRHDSIPLASLRVPWNAADNDEVIEQHSNADGRSGSAAAVSTAR
jgi:hypothetical protein